MKCHRLAVLSGMICLCMYHSIFAGAFPCPPVRCLYRFGYDQFRKVFTGLYQVTCLADLSEGGGYGSQFQLLQGGGSITTVDGVSRFTRAAWGELGGDMSGIDVEAGGVGAGDNLLNIVVQVPHMFSYSIITTNDTDMFARNYCYYYNQTPVTVTVSTPAPPAPNPAPNAYGQEPSPPQSKQYQVQASLLYQQPSQNQLAPDAIVAGTAATPKPEWVYVRGTPDDQTDGPIRKEVQCQGDPIVVCDFDISSQSSSGN